MPGHKHPPEPASDADILRERGERLTPQRLLVLDAVRETPGHVSAETIQARVNEQFPSINRATIYRALAWLNEQGFVSITDIGGDELVYEYLTADRHHHLVCQHCGNQETIADDIVAPMLSEVRARHGFEPRLDHLALFGTCRACLEIRETHLGGRGAGEQ